MLILVHLKPTVPPLSHTRVLPCLSVMVRIKGAGAGRESALRAIHAAGIKIKAIRDITPIPLWEG